MTSAAPPGRSFRPAPGRPDDPSAESSGATAAPVLPTTRRGLLAGTAATAITGAVTGALTGLADPAEAAGLRWFQHGVASGDPLPHACVIWTRLTPTPVAQPGSGRGPRVAVAWQVARDPRFRHVVSSGRTWTGPGRDHTVKVDVHHLQPARWYYYRFRYRGGTSRVGRLRTAPAPDATPANVRFGVVSCSNLQAGWFAPYRHLAARNDLHAILHLGDYIYEYGPGEYGYGPGNRDVRRHRPAHEIVSLADYRRRHAQYKQDRDLQNLHAKYPFIVTWDDHESSNDAWRGGAENHQPATEGPWARRRTSSHRAYDEWMPVRLSGTAALDDGTRLYRRLQFGQLAELTMLDLRSYRSEQDRTKTADQAGTITGDAQMAFLRDSLRNRHAQWKLVGNPVMISPVTFGDLPDAAKGNVRDATGLFPQDGVAYNVDQWDGYTADRRRVFDTIRNHAVDDVVFLTGDIHSAWACDVPYDAATYPLGGNAGVEYVCTSVTSNNLDDILASPPRSTSLGIEGAIQASNRHVRYLNFDDHGYSVFDVTPRRAQMDWFVVSDRADPDATSRWTRSFRTLAGSRRATPVDAPLGRRA